jgi:hypothetical protein
MDKNRHEFFVQIFAEVITFVLNKKFGTEIIFTHRTRSNFLS